MHKIEKKSFDYKISAKYALNLKNPATLIFLKIILAHFKKQYFTILPKI